MADSGVAACFDAALPTAPGTRALVVGSPAEAARRLPDAAAMADEDFVAAAGADDLDLIVVPDLDALFSPIDVLAAASRRLRIGGRLLLAARAMPAHLAVQAGRCGLVPTEFPHGLELTLARRPPWTAGRLGAAQAPAMAALFEAVFGAPMSPAFWRWKYGDGRGVAVGVRNAEGRLVAHVGGIHRALSWFGEPRQAVQCCDVAVAVGERGSLSRQGPFFMAMATFLELEIGDGAPAYVGFGFPNRRAYVLPEKLGLYSHCGRVFEARWPTAPRRPFLATRVSELERAASPPVDRLFDRAWRAMAGSMPDCVLGVRDAAYLRHRYCDHPDHVYRLLAVRRRLGGGLLGIAVLRHGAAGEGACELLDLIGDRAAMPAVLAQARRFAARLGARSLFSWLSENALAALRTDDMDTRDIEVVIPANRWTAARGAERARGHWWLTGGDTDFR